MYLVVKHPSINPEKMVQLGEFPQWLEQLAPLVDSASTVEVGHLRLNCDPKNTKMVSDIVRTALQGCAILRVLRAPTASTR